MCDLIDRIEDETVVGYKVLLYNKKEDVFYSTFTGQVIKKGPVPMPPEKATRLSHHWSTYLENVPFSQCSFYSKRFAGKTGVFVWREAAENMFETILETGFTFSVGDFEDLELVIVKMKLGGELWKGTYGGYNIFAGPLILEIEIVKSEPIQVEF